MDNAFAVFAVAEVPGGIAATTRAADRGERGRIGLPGGKVDPGETDVLALAREAAEEGWDLHGSPDTWTMIHEGTVEGRLVRWFQVPGATQRTKFKERGRITPVIRTRAEIATSGYGNDFLA